MENICTIVLLRYGYVMSVDNYSGVIQDPEYFAKHYHSLGYRVIIKADVEVNGKPERMIYHHNFIPGVDIMNQEKVYHDVLPIPVKVTPVEKEKKFYPLKTKPDKKKEYQKIYHGKMRNHSWKEVSTIPYVTCECRNCGCKRIYRQSVFIYVTPDGTESKAKTLCKKY